MCEILQKKKKSFFCEIFTKLIHYWQAADCVPAHVKLQTVLGPFKAASCNAEKRGGRICCRPRRMYCMNVLDDCMYAIKYEK
jgi:hypothetical protein